jgi:hypothetical protein
MVADELEELHRMAAAIDIPKQWFHEGSMPHYDVTSGKRAQAIARGAEPIDRRGLIALKRRYRLKTS